MGDQKLAKLYFEVEPAYSRSKLGDYLFDNLNGLSKMYLRELIRDGKCEVNGAHENSGYRLRPKDFIEIEADMSRGTAMKPQQIALEIIYEDPHIIVINKPAGMLVHPTHRDKNETLLNGLVYHLNRSRGDSSNASADERASFIRPSLPHRLDKQTSGLIVAAKSLQAHRRLSSDLFHKRVEKRYLARVEGMVADDEGLIDLPIGRFADEKLWSVKADGKASLTRYWVRQRMSDTTLLELEPVTGRTNQLRIHCQSVGHPIVGDTARDGRPFQRLCLHAYRLAFSHPVHKDPLRFEVEVPVEFDAAISYVQDRFALVNIVVPLP